jgi:hypothetical protein
MSNPMDEYTTKQLNFNSKENPGKRLASLCVIVTGEFVKSNFTSHLEILLHLEKLLRLEKLLCLEKFLFWQCRGRLSETNFKALGDGESFSTATLPTAWVPPFSVH